MKFLVLGSGGREHALAWRFARQSGIESVYLHPGNAATQGVGFRSLGDIPLADREGLVLKAKALGVELVVIGPETLLAKGYADSFREAGFLVVGVSKLAARLESSKSFAKVFMERSGIPTAPFFVVKTSQDLERRLGREFPTVLKLDGLAAGKGVVIAATPQDVREFVRRVWEDGEFGPGPHEIVVEKFLTGREISYIGLCDGERFVAFDSATDYKRVGDGDQGGNTGGMGCISPSPHFSPELEDRIQKRVVAPFLQGLQREGIDFRGVLFIGLMITAAGDPMVLEFNARFGDPETQALMLRLDGDFVGLMTGLAKGTLRDAPLPRWKRDAAVYVVAASQGYPESPRLGDPIQGLDGVPGDVQVFFSGVRERAGSLVTGGGRVLGVGALAPSYVDARQKAYAALNRIQFDGMHFRTDIGAPVSR